MPLERLGEQILCIFTVGALPGGYLWQAFGEAWRADSVHIYCGRALWGVFVACLWRGQIPTHPPNRQTHRILLYMALWPDLTHGKCSYGYFNISILAYLQYRCVHNKVSSEEVVFRKAFHPTP